MKKLIFFLLLLFALTFPKNSIAYTEDEEVCYSQCATYKFVWQGDFCYDTFQNECVIGKGQTIRDTIKFLKGIHSTISSGGGVDNVFKAWFVCKPLIENCIVPQLRNCRTTCSEDPLHYAPDISVGSPYANFVYHGVVYNERDHTLTFKVINNGMGYAWDIRADASWGHTRIRDGQVSRGGQLFDETIPELLYAGARNGPPKTVGDYIGDFMIEETNFSEYLQFLKSDADDYIVPSIWYKTIPFTPPGGELTKVTFNVDSNQMIKERSELNNSFVLVIDNLPTPPAFEIENFSQRLEENTLNNFLIDFNIKNTGEENGEATVKIFEGKYNGTSSQNPVWQSNRVVQGLNIFNFNTFIAPNITVDDAYCGRFKKYELIVFKDNIRVDSHEFSLPLYSGSVRGRVEDLFGKGVEGATVTASSGQMTTTSKTGSYFLKNINQLGKVIITVTHSEFSKVETREIEFKMGDGINPCDEGSLTFNQVNFVLKDQDVNFTISIKDSFGNPVTANVLATNPDWRFNETIEGNGPLPGMQPGEYFFTISAPGYKTIGQTVNAVPNQQNLEFVMEILNGRLTDGGLTIHEPQLLWEIDRGNEVFANMTATKDGKELILYTTQNRPNTGKLYFLDLETGNQIRVNSTIASGGNSQSALDTSYDGNTTCLFVHVNGTNKDTRRNILNLYNNQGISIGNLNSLNPMKSVSLCEVSPDGFYVYPFQLINKGLYQYTNREILGQEHNNDPAANGGIHFTTANNIIGNCAQDGGYCVETLNNTVVNNLGNLNGNNPRQADSSQDGNKIAVITNKNAFLFGGNGQIWQKDVVNKSNPLDISITPGGKMAIYSTYVEGQNHRTIKIFSDSNVDKTPTNLPSNQQEDVLFVHANDKGIYFATNEQKQIKLYKVGSYSNDYNPTTPPPTSEGQQNANNISYYDNGIWRGVGQVNYLQLLPGRLYMANTTLTLDVTEPWGRMTFMDGTIFGTDNYLHPVLLKGQITAEFSNSREIYGIKFDRFDLNLFAEKLAQFTAGNLPQSEFFLVSNVHTKFIVKNYENMFDVISINGEVQIIGNDVNETIETGKQISIDGENNIKETIYLSWKIYAIISGVLVLISSALLYIYRKTKVGGKIIEILKKTVILFWKYFRLLLIWIWMMVQIILIWFWKIVKKLVPILWKYLKKLGIYLFELIKKLMKFLGKKN